MALKAFGDRTGLLTLARREVVRFFVVYSQTLLPPLISSTLFLFVFGLSLGRSIGTLPSGVPYLHFMVPGLVMMHLIESPYANTSSSLFISRWHNMIQELLVSPLSYFEMVLGLLAGGVCRGLIVGTGVYAVTLCFARFPLAHPLLVLYFFATVTVIFACLGLVVGLWADGFEKLSFWSTFVITPLVYFGGVFHSVEMVPEVLRWLTRLNPVFYLVNGLRYGMLGVADADVRVCAAVAALMAAGLFAAVERLFRAGYKLRS